MWEGGGGVELVTTGCTAVNSERSHGEHCAKHYGFNVIAIAVHLINRLVASVTAADATHIRASDDVMGLGLGQRTRASVCIQQR
jgi:hypothetical protein